MTDAEADQAIRVLGGYRDARFAELVTFVIALAAETHPEELRKALAKVFDLGAIEETTKRMMNVVNEVQKAAIEFRDKTRAEILEMARVIHKTLDKLEQRIDSAENRQKLLEYRQLNGRPEGATK